MTKPTTTRARINAAYDMTSAEARMQELHTAFEAGRVSREEAMLELAKMTEQKLFSVTEGGKDKNVEFNNLFAIFRDGAKAQNTSDMALRSRVLKVCLAAQLCRDTNNPFTATLATVAALHADATKAAKADKAKAEPEGVEYPRQLIECYYEAAKLQTDTESAEPLDNDTLRDEAVAKPGKVNLNDSEKFIAAINAIVKAFNPLIGSIDGKSKAKKLGLAQTTIDGLKRYRNDLARLAQPVTAADVQAEQDRKDAEAFRAMMAEKAAKKAAAEQKKNGNATAK